MVLEIYILCSEKGVLVLSIRPKIPVWNFENFTWANGTVNPEIFRLVTSQPGWTEPFHSEISRNLLQRSTGNRNFFEWNSYFRSEPSNRKKAVHPQRWTFFPKLFRSDRTVPFSFGPKFPQIWLNGNCPGSVFGGPGGTSPPKTKMSNTPSPPAPAQMLNRSFKIVWPMKCRVRFYLYVRPICRDKNYGKSSFANHSSVVVRC